MMVGGAFRDTELMSVEYAEKKTCEPAARASSMAFTSQKSRSLSPSAGKMMPSFGAQFSTTASCMGRLKVYGMYWLMATTTPSTRMYGGLAPVPGSKVLLAQNSTVCPLVKARPMLV